MGKMKPGGLSGGLFIVEYSDMFLLKRADNVPTARGMRMAIIKALLFFIFMSMVSCKMNLIYYMKLGWEI